MTVNRRQSSSYPTEQRKCSFDGMVEMMIMLHHTVFKLVVVDKLKWKVKTSFIKI